MNFRFLGLTVACVAALSSINVQAAGVLGKVNVEYLGEDVGGSPAFGQGINYHVKFTADAAGTASVRTDEILAGGTVVATKSKAWNDLQADINGDTEKNPLGWAHNSKWALIDLSSLKGKGYTNATVSIQLLPYNDKIVNEVDSSGNPLDDDHLVPALTLWRGIDQVTVPASAHWYPNNFQMTEGPWWASFASHGITAISGTPDSPAAKTSYVVKLNGTNDYLTLAIAGNNTTLAAGHNENFKLIVAVTPR